MTDDGLSLLTHWKRNDLSDAEIAQRIGISDKTMQTWKKRFLPISTALKKGIEYAVADAEKALVEKFKTQTLIEEKEEVWQNEDGSVRKHKTVTKKQIPPDTTALIFFLKAKGGWRDNTELRLATSITDERRKEIDDFFRKNTEQSDT